MRVVLNATNEACNAGVFGGNGEHRHVTVYACTAFKFLTRRSSPATSVASASGRGGPSGGPTGALPCPRPRDEPPLDTDLRFSLQE